MEANQICVADLPVTADEEFLRTLFCDCGEIVPNGIVLKKHETLDKACAYITFATHEGAARAISELNYTKFDGIPIRILWNDPETIRIRKSRLGILFIRGLEESIEVSQLHEAFSNFGEIISCKIPLTDGKSRGYGYIQFRNPADAEKARMDLADASINGKQIAIEQYTKQAKENPDETFTIVFIKPLPAEKFANDDDLRKFMESMGEVQSVKLVKDKDGNAFTDRTTGKMTVFGFCNYKKHEDAVRATQELVEFDGEKLLVCRAMTKQERMKFLQKQVAEFRRMKNEQPMGQMIQMPQNDTPKNGIKQYLQDKGIASQKLKEKLVSISDEQAQALLENPEALEKWSEY